MTDSYNGFSWNVRMAKYRDMQRALSSGTLKALKGPCRLCGDPGGPTTDVTFEYHDEDYGTPYSWDEPAAYVVCRSCHIYRIHQRFARPESWRAYLAHVARGGYARDMREPEVKQELAAFRAASKSGNVLPQLRSRNGGRRAIEGEWFFGLSLRPDGSIPNKQARP
jgi:hypothetical protein